MAKGTKQKLERCEQCGSEIDYYRPINPKPTLCVYCAAEKYYSLKAHIRDKLQFWFNANYQAGVRFERELKDLLEKAGYYVMRSAGSHGPADLIAIKDGKTYIISCKRDFRDLKKLEPDKVDYLLNLCKDNNYVPVSGSNYWYANVIPIHAKKWHRVVTLIDLRTGKEVKLF